jgi:hypothetical protein
VVPSKYKTLHPNPSARKEEGGRKEGRKEKKEREIKEERRTE